MNRRKFIKISAGAAAAAGASGIFAGTSAWSAGMKPVVVVVRSGAVASKKDMTAAVYRSLLDETFKSVSSEISVIPAVRKIASSSEIMGFKLNLLAGPGLCPSPDMVRAVAGIFGSAGFDRQKIIFWERHRQELKRSGFNSIPGATLLATDDPGVGYEAEPVSNGSIGSCFSKILTRRIDVLVSVGVVKDHDLSGISCGAKNLYGCIHNPNKYHDGNCDPYLPDLLSSRPIKDKLRFTILDATKIQLDGGPLYIPSSSIFFGGVIAGSDVIAVDSVARSIIEKERKRHGFPSLKAVGREPRWLATAGKRGIGVADLGGIEVIEKVI